MKAESSSLAETAPEQRLVPESHFLVRQWASLENPEDTEAVRWIRVAFEGTSLESPGHTDTHHCEAEQLLAPGESVGVVKTATFGGQVDKRRIVINNDGELNVRVPRDEVPTNGWLAE